MTYLELQAALRDAQTATFLLWCLLCVLAALVVMQDGWKPPNAKGRGLTTWCTQHGLPSHECRDRHRPD